MQQYRIRLATAEDLPAVHAIWYANEVAGDPNPPPPTGVLSTLRHMLATGDLLVAEREGAIAGFAGLIRRGRLAFLTDLFVRPDIQSAGIGGALLGRILPRQGYTLATLSSRDFRALALYVRTGMRPRWPNFWLRAESSHIGKLPGDVQMRAAEPGDPELTRWDAEVSGRERPDDLAYWERDRAAAPFWFERAGRRVGYGYVQQGSEESLWFPEAYTIGPVGAASPDDARGCVVAAVAWARERSPLVRLGVPGPHPALPVLLDAGFRITDIETFLTSDSVGVPDVTRHLPSGSTFF
jgi:GNAT superfamily N-acetyltransferase